MSSSTSLLDKLGEDISKSLNIQYKPTGWSGGYEGGGGGAKTGSITDANGKMFFVKQGNLGDYAMLNAEYEGIKEMYMTNTIKVPQPICMGTSDYSTYVIFEELNFGGSGKPELFAEKLIAMHQKISPNGMFGWKMNNTIGATFQPNNYEKTWSEFYIKHRLGYMLELCKGDGATFPQEAQLIEKVQWLLDNHDCVPSLIMVWESRLYERWSTSDL